MNTIDKFNSFIDRFNCCAKQLQHRGYQLHNTQWNLDVSKSTKTYIIKAAAPLPTNPLSLMLEGRKINISMFGKRENYGPYCASYYPYHTIEPMFLFGKSTLTQAFYQGYQNQTQYKNVYTANEEQSIAFDLGRFFLHSYFGIHLPYTIRPFFR